MVKFTQISPELRDQCLAAMEKASGAINAEPGFFEFMTDGVKNWSSRKLKAMLPQAFEMAWKQEIVCGAFALQNVEPQLMFPAADLGMAFLIIATAARRGIHPSPVQRKQIEDEMLLIAKEAGAESVGKLKVMDRR